jgi:alpha-tubulin suppressor-like RCC1 family protein
MSENLRYSAFGFRVARIQGTPPVVEEEDSDGDGYLASEDCDDGSDFLHPYDADGDGFEEACGWKDFDLGERHTCAIDSDDNLHCWGAGETIDNCQPTQAPPQHCGQADPPAGSFSDVECSSRECCALDLAGEITCWGNDHNGLLSTIPAGTFESIYNFITSNSCAMDSDGALTCWGHNHAGQTEPPAETFVSLDVGANNGCGLDSSGAIHCWGYDYHSVNDAPTDPGYTDVGVGAQTACAIDSDGLLERWGVPTGDSDGPDTQLTDMPSGTFDSIWSNAQTHCAQDSDGDITCWGENNSDQLDVPEGDFTDLDIGYGHVCAMDTSGLLSCWGRNTSGQTDVP